MSKAIGVELAAAIKKASAWGTAVACGAGDGVLILPSSVGREREGMVDDSLGLYFARGMDLGSIKSEGDIPAYLRYDSLDLLIALAMGATGGAPSQQGATSAYAQTFTLADNLDGLFATFCLNNNINIEECAGLKVAGLTIKGQAGKPLEVTFHVMADDRIVNSATNTLATFANVTFTETANRVLFSQGVFRMNAQGGAALASPTDDINPSSFELMFKRNLAGVYSADQTDKIDEPSNNDAPEVTLKLEFPRYTASTYFTDWDAANRKKADITFTGAQIESPYNRVFKLQFPNLQLKSADLPKDKGILKHPLEFACLGCDTAPTGMTGITLPFQVDVVNQETADVLA